MTLSEQLLAESPLVVLDGMLFPDPETRSRFSNFITELTNAPFDEFDADGALPYEVTRSLRTFQDGALEYFPQSSGAMILMILAGRPFTVALQANHTDPDNFKWRFRSDTLGKVYTKDIAEYLQQNGFDMSQIPKADDYLKNPNADYSDASDDEALGIPKKGRWGTGIEQRYKRQAANIDFSVTDVRDHKSGSPFANKALHKAYLQADQDLFRELKADTDIDQLVGTQRWRDKMKAWELRKTHPNTRELATQDGQDFEPKQSTWESFLKFFS